MSIPVTCSKCRTSIRVKETQAGKKGKCPKCGMDLHEIDYRTIKIDKCTGCDGVWLDAGELEAIAKLEQSALRRVLGVFRGSAPGEG